MNKFFNGDDVEKKETLPSKLNYTPVFAFFIHTYDFYPKAPMYPVGSN